MRIKNKVARVTCAGALPISNSRRGLGDVDAVVDAALFLASDDCKWIAGHSLNVDGGYGAVGLSYDLSAK